MITKVKLWKAILKKICCEDESYTIMLVPDDGTDIKKKNIENRQMKRALYLGASAVSIFFVCFCVMSAVIYTSVKEQKELSEFRAVKHIQAQKLQELEAMTVDMQKNMAALNQLEDQIREQMAKSGIEVPEKNKRDSEHNAKGGPGKIEIQEIDIFKEQNKTLMAEQTYVNGNLSKILSVLKQENYRKEVTPDVWPLSGGYVTSEFGSRANPFDNSSGDYHPGIAIAANYGTPIIATASGNVEMAGWYGGYGKYIRIEHDYGYSTIFGHLSSIAVSAGEYVTKGQVIGYVGSTGYSTGPHLHYEIMQYGEEMNPRQLMK